MTSQDHQIFRQRMFNSNWSSISKMKQQTYWWRNDRISECSSVLGKPAWMELLEFWWHV